MGDLWVTPIGVGAAYARPGEIQSSYLIGAGRTRICCDLGAGALNALQSHIAPEDLDSVVISHLHADHCVDLFALRVYMFWGPGRGRRIRLIGPPGLREALVGFAGSDGWDECFDIEIVTPPRDVRTVGDAGLVFREVPHSHPTFAVRIEHGDRSVIYGADCRYGEELAELARGGGILIAECGDGASTRDDTVHMSGAEAGAVAAAAGVGRLLLTHCYPEHDRAATLEAARGAFAGDVAWAEQGTRLDVR